MQFLATTKPGAAEFTSQLGGNAARKGNERMFSDLSMYSTPPSENITLEEFERLALARLSGEARGLQTCWVPLLAWG